MRILQTGASSFTGYWFAKALAAKGHEVVAPMRARPTETTLRARRIAALPATVHYDCAFGSQAFLELAAQGPWHLLCHHAAEVSNYRSADFDVPAALAANTNALSTVLKTLQSQGLRGVVLTGSIFEPDEGAGTTPLKAFSPYGLSKALTAELVAYWCDRLAVPFTKFVIANPFGPYEEPRFCHYLIETWRRGATAEVRTPLYVRDNIHVDLLAACYAWLCDRLAAGQGPHHLAPSQYAETQGAFAQRVASAVASRSGLPCPLALAPRQAFDEPAMRIATDPAAILCPDWDEAAAWNQLVAFYFNP